MTLQRPRLSRCRVAATDRVQLGHGSGGQAERGAAPRPLPAALRQPDPATSSATPRSCRCAAARSPSRPTRSWCSPLEFPGGNIGALAVHGTVNDLAMMGARAALPDAGRSCSRKGLPFEVLDRDARRDGGRGARGRRHRSWPATPRWSSGARPTACTSTPPASACSTRCCARRPTGRAPGDAVLVSGADRPARHGDHGAREGLEFETTIDQRHRRPLAAGASAARRASGPRCTCCATRRAAASRARSTRSPPRRGVGIVLDEAALPVPAGRRRRLRDAGARSAVRGQRRRAAWRSCPRRWRTRRSPRCGRIRSAPRAGASATSCREHPGMVVLRTALGGTRVVDMLPGDQLPRIC